MRNCMHPWEHLILVFVNADTSWSLTHSPIHTLTHTFWPGCCVRCAWIYVMCTWFLAEAKAHWMFYFRLNDLLVSVTWIFYAPHIYVFTCYIITNHHCYIYTCIWYASGEIHTDFNTSATLFLMYADTARLPNLYHMNMICTKRKYESVTMRRQHQTLPLHKHTYPPQLNRFSFFFFSSPFLPLLLQFFF